MSLVEISSNRFYDYTKQKRQKLLDTDTNCRPVKRSPSEYLVHREHKPQVHSTFVLFFCAQNLIQPRILGWTMVNKKILKKFPKIKASVNS